MPELRIDYFRTAGGHKPVREFLDELPDLPKAACEQVIEYLETGEIDQRPRHRDHLGDGLWELRISFQGMQYRIIYATDSNVATLLSGFIKKTPQTPQRQLDIARKRLAEHKKGGRTP
jgi:phage-related protein